MAQSNMTVLSGALMTRILFDRHRATASSSTTEEGLRAEATCETILSLGAIHTPKLLMQSGVGNEAEFKRARIPVRQCYWALDGTVHDHVAFGCTAALVNFFASERCSFVTGQIIYVDGGLSAGALDGTM
jgi:choline dehydrogenase-like flavoprotein